MMLGRHVPMVASWSALSANITGQAIPADRDVKDRWLWLERQSWH
jgi:hypothetical protein